MSRFRQLLFLLILTATQVIFAQKRKSKKPEEEPKPQVLAVLPQPPEALTVETARLTYQVSPLSDKGLLSQQVRDALKALERQARGGTLVKLRAFVAGSGDLRRVKEIVSEEFADRKLALPVVSTIQVGALPMIGAQVVLEGTALDRKAVSLQGLAFISGVTTRNPAASVAQLKQATDAAGVKANDVLRITCFLSSLDQLDAGKNGVTAAFPMAAANFVQMQRLGIEPQVSCEAVGRLSAAPASPLVITKGYALANTGKLVLTETQLAFRDQDSDLRLAFQRLIKTLAAQGALPKDVFWTSTFALTRPVEQKLDSLRGEFLDQSHPPAGTSLLIEGLPSTDATAAIEVMAIHN